MTPAQQNEIIAHVANSTTWTQAATLAGVHPERLTLFVLAVKQGRRLDFTGFVHRLEAAGRRATENSLKSTRKSVSHAQKR